MKRAGLSSGARAVEARPERRFWRRMHAWQKAATWPGAAAASPGSCGLADAFMSLGCGRPVTRQSRLCLAVGLGQPPGQWLAGAASG